MRSLEELTNRYPMLKLMYELYLKRATGKIIGDISHAEASQALFLQEGSPIAAGNLEDEAEFTQSLVQLGFLSPSQLGEETNKAAEAGKHLAQFLMARGVLNNEQMRRIQKHMLLFEVAKICAASKEPSFIENETPHSNKLDKPVNLFGVIAFIYMNFTTPAILEEFEQSCESKLFFPKRNLQYLLPAMELEPKMQSVLEGWTLPRTHHDLSAVTGLNPREVLALLVTLKIADALESREKPERMAHGNGGSGSARKSNDAKARAAHNATKVQGANLQANRKEAVRPKAQATAKAERRRTNRYSIYIDDSALSKDLRDKKAAIEAKLKELETNNPAVILGVSPKAERNEVKMKFNALARTFHPDSLAGTPLVALSNSCSKIFSAMGNAMQIMIDENHRKEFFQALDDPVIKGDMKKWEMRKRAKLEIDKAKLLFKQERYRDFINQANRALMIFPHEPELLSMLAWALYNTTQDPNQGYERAQKYFSRAEKIDPNHDNIFLYRGIIAQEEGDIAGAIRYFERAVTSNPKNLQAKTELNRIRQAYGA